MKITVKQLRKVIKEELLREEKTAQQKKISKLPDGKLKSDLDVEDSELLKTGRDSETDDKADELARREIWEK